MSNILEKICNTTRTHVDKMRTHTPLEQLKEKIQDTAKPRGFLLALKNQSSDGSPALIAEIKKASPSKGIIRADFNPVEIAKAYETAGASCLSVLTDEPYFQGSDEIFRTVRQSSPMPMLRKDFIVDSYQIYETRAMGADCLLLIMAALSDSEFEKFYALAKELELDVLVETHDKQEIERALSVSPDMIGVNSRNLKTLEVSLNTAHQLADMIPDSTFKIAESGIKTSEDIIALQKNGYKGFLVGESLMQHDDIVAATRNLIGTK